MESEKMIQVTGLGKTVGGEAILRDVTFSFAKKGVHGILGPKGAGKTALMEILAGMDSCYEGTVRMGERVLDSDSVEWKRKIGYLPECLELDPDMTVSETLDFVGQTRGVPSEKRYRQIKEAMELTGLSELRNRLAVKLNGGQTKKLGFAASLLGNPDVLLLDEPAGAIGTEEREEMHRLIRMLGEIKTVLLAVECFDEAKELCEDIVLFADGRVLATGTFDELEEKLNRRAEETPTSLREIYESLSAPVSPKTKEFEEDEA